MANLQFGIQAAVTGVSVVFIVLIVLSIVMMLLEKSLGEKEQPTQGPSKTKARKETEKKEKPKVKKKLSKEEKIAAVTAIKQYQEDKTLTNREMQAALGAILKHTGSKSKVLTVKKPSNWKFEGRRVSMK